MLPTMGD